MSAITTGMSHTLRETYDRDGYLILRGVLNGADLDELRDAIDSPLLQHEREINKRADYGGLSIIHDIIHLHPAFLKMARHPGMLDVVEGLVGPNIEIQHDKINWKPVEQNAGEVKWHQDFPYLPHSNFDVCAAFIVLDETRPENGCMRVIPGSHKLGQLNHVDENGKLLRHVNDDRFDESRHEAVDLQLSPGDISIHHVLALHSSYPNRAANPRCAIIYEYRAADAMQIAGGLTKSTGVLVRGQASKTVRCDAGVVWLPPK